MTTRERLSILYAAPGQHLVPWAGPTRNVLSVAEALAEWADVTVAFRQIAVPPETTRYRVVAIEPGAAAPPEFGDDNATRGAHPLKHLAYCRRLAAFAREQAGSFDVVLEKGWRLSGWLATAFVRAGVPAVVVENDVRAWTEPLGGVRQLAKYALHGLAHGVAAACCRRTPRVIAETETLKAMIVARRGVPAERIDVVGLGVDHRLFRPMEQAASRQALGIAPEAFVMLYVGAMDEYHDLGPVLAALARQRSAVELHVVGDGEYRPRYEAMATAAGLACRFHGRVPHAEVPRYIAAADLCIAPYRTDAFRERRLTFSTLKIPEYMACARPVVSVPGAGPSTLVTSGVTGFVVENDEPSWEAFLEKLPARERLASMRAAAAEAAAGVTWTGTAAGYLEVCRQVIRRDAGTRTAHVVRSAGARRSAAG